MSQSILICDDDQLLIELIEFRLQGKGYTVLTAHDGEEALAKIRAEKPDLVVLDAMMPGIDGFALLQGREGYCLGARSGRCGLSGQAVHSR